MSKAQVENPPEISLVTRTLEWIELLPEVSDEHKPAMRDLLVNLCDFQYRFATPLEIPFGIGPEIKGTLPTPRPFQVLIRYNAAIPIEIPMLKLSQDDGFEFKGGRYVYAGGKTWTDMVAKKQLQGDEARVPPITRRGWLLDLFRVLSTTTDAQSAFLARNLAACWYHVATELSLDDHDDDNLDLEEDAHRIGAIFTSLANPDMVNMMMGGEEGDEMEFDGSDDENQLPEGAEDDMETDGMTFADLLARDVEDEDADDYDPEKDDDKDYDSDGMYDEDDGEEEDGNLPTIGQPRTMADLYLKAEDDGQDDEEYQPDDGEGDGESDDMNDVASDGYHEPDPAEQLEFIKSILEYVKLMSAYWPDPKTDSVWFKRVVQATQASADPRWFPWGIPHATNDAEDMTLREHSALVLHLIESIAQQQAALAEAMANADDDDEEDDEMYEN